MRTIIRTMHAEQTPAIAVLPDESKVVMHEGMFGKPSALRA